MQNYVEQLLEDLQKAIENQASYNILNLDLLDPGHLLEYDHQILFNPLFNLSSVVGIDASLLPSGNLLNNEQIELLVAKIELLLKNLKIYPDFPHQNNNEVPPRMRYKAMKENWECCHATIGVHEIHLDFCTTKDEENCPFPGYCNKCQNKVSIEDIDKNIESEDFYKTIQREDEGFIPSIFNYCDRWCERCDFTSKCRNFAMQKEFLKEMESHEKSFDEKIKDIEEHLNDTSSGDYFEQSETDPLFGDEDDDDTDDFFSDDKKSERHPISLMSQDYSDKAYHWLKTMTKTCKSDFTKWLALGTADMIFTAIDTVNWYHIFIYPKIRRAISGFYELDEDEYAAYDMNGSAKVTLIAIDSSIEAFAFLSRHIKSHRNEMADLSKLLKVLRNDIETMFPEARSFVRPGLDEPDFLDETG